VRIGILSDIHDHIGRLREALDRLEGADTLLCCGDLCAPFMVDELADGFDGPVHVVFGNNDGDRFRITRAADGRGNLTLWGETAEIPADRTDGTRVALHHFPTVGRRLAESGAYDLVCWGHTHEWDVVREGDTLGVNPGEIMGRLGPTTFAAYETGTGELERHEL
jgi:putative phosphoesterase